MLELEAGYVFLPQEKEKAQLGKRQEMEKWEKEHLYGRADFQASFDSSDM